MSNLAKQRVFRVGLLLFISSCKSPFDEVKMQNTRKTLASTYYLLPLYDANTNYLTIPKK